MQLSDVAAAVAARVHSPFEWFACVRAFGWHAIFFPLYYDFIRRKWRHECGHRTQLKMSVCVFVWRYDLCSLSHSCAKLLRLLLLLLKTRGGGSSDDVVAAPIKLAVAALH